MLVKFHFHFLGFFAEENSSLLDYVANFDALCANKACERYLQRARDIMKEDLQDMIEVGPQVCVKKVFKAIPS